MKRKSFLIFVKFLQIGTALILLMILCLNISTLWSVGKIKRDEIVTSGYFCTIISSGSMAPNVLVNDMLLVKGGISYQVEDIITYVSPLGSLITHRIKELSKHGYITQGDANNISDGEISHERVLGKVVLVIPGVGGIFSPVGVILLGCICLLGWLFQRVIRGNQDEKIKTVDSFKDITENGDKHTETKKI